MVRDLPENEIYDVDYGYTNVVEWLQFELHSMFLQELYQAEKAAEFDRLAIHGERKETEMSETGEIDTILLLEFGSPSAPLEVILSETKPGSPEEIRKHLESLKIRSGLFVYVAGYNKIFTAEEYLALWNRADHVFYLEDLAKCSAPVKTGSPRDLMKYLKDREVGSWKNYYVVRTDIAQVLTPAQYISNLSSAEPA